MTSPASRQRRGPERPVDLEDMDPREGLWAFSFAWLHRSGAVVEEAKGPESPAVAAPSAPPKRKRAPRRDLVDPFLDFRRRALAWLTRPPAPPPAEPKARKRASRPPPAMSLRERAYLWIARPSAPPVPEPRRKRTPRVVIALGLRERAFAWLARPRKAAVSELKPRRRAARAPVELGLRRRAFLWLTRASAVKARVVEAPQAPVVEAPPPEPRVAPPRPEPRRKRAPKGSIAIPLQRRAFVWLTELGPKRRAQAEDDAIEALSGDAKLAISEVARTHLRGVLEALIFASESPLPARELARLARADIPLVKALLAELVAEYHGRGFRLDEIAGGFLFRTSPAFAPFVREQVAKKPVRMSRAQIETLAIVAYRQPVTRPEVDDVRGVDSGAVLKSLLERDLVRILGKKDEPGRPMLYGTTPEFLAFFGLKALGDLPTLREFTELSDDSRRTYEREMGEEPPDDPSAPFPPPGEGLMGGEGSLQKAAAPTLEELENMPEDMMEAVVAEPAAEVAAGEEEKEEGEIAVEGEEGGGLPAMQEEEGDGDGDGDGNGNGNGDGDGDGDGDGNGNGNGNGNEQKSDEEDEDEDDEEEGDEDEDDDEEDDDEDEDEDDDEEDDDDE